MRKIEVFKLFGSIFVNDKASTALDDVEKKAKGTDLSISNLGKTMSSIGEKVSSVGTNLTKFITTPLIGVGIVAAKVSNDFDAQMSRVKAISGATGEQFSSLRNQAIQLGADTAFSAKQASEGMENLASAGFDTNEIMKAMPGMLNLAASSGEDLANSADIAASTLRGFGLEADQAGHVADVLAKNAAETNAAVSDTGQAMKYVAPVAHSMGLSIEEVTAAIGEMSNAGIKGEQAGTTLRGALTRLANPSKEAADAIQELGFKAYDSHGKMLPMKDMLANLQKSMKGLTDQQQQQAISTIFGQEAMSGMLVLAQGGPETLDKLTQSLKNSNGAAAEMAKTMQDNEKSALEQLGGSLETVAIKLNDVVKGPITQWINKATDFVNSISKMDSTTLKAGLSFGALALAAGPALLGFGKLTEFTGKFQTSIGEGIKTITAFGSKSVDGFKKASDGVSTFMGSSSKVPTFLRTLGNDAKIGFGMVSSAAGEKLAPLGSIITSKLSPIGNAATSIFQKLPAGLQVSFDKLGGVFNKLPGFASKIAGPLSSLGGKVTSGLKSVVSLGLKMFAPAALIGVLLLGLGVAQQKMGGQLDKVIADVTKKGPQLIQKFTSGLLAKIPDLIKTGTTLLMNLINALTANAPAILTSAVAIMTSLVNGVITNLPRLIPVVLQLIQTIIIAIVDNLPKIILAGLNLLVALAQGISNNITQIVNTIITVVMEIIKVLIQNLPLIIEAGIKILVALIQGLSQAIPQLIEALPQIVQAIWDGLKQVDWGTLGSNIIDGIIAGIKAAGKGIFHVLKAVAGDALQGVKDFLGIHSPSRKFRDEIGKFIPEGIAAGIDENGDVVNSTLEDLSKSLKFNTDLQTTLNASANLGVTKTASPLSENLINVKSPVSGLVNTNKGNEDNDLLEILNAIFELIKIIANNPAKFDMNGRTLWEALSPYAALSVAGRR